MAELLDLGELLKRQEPMCDELLPYVVQGKRFKYLSHPLVQAVPLFDIEHCALLNWQLQQKKHKLKEAEQRRDFHQYIFLHERPYRFSALEHVLGTNELSDKQQAELVGAVWQDSENIWQNNIRWKAIWRTLKCPRAAMDEAELAALAQLPMRIIIYRGLRRKNHNAKGLSWTLSLEKAHWFATRFSSDKPVILEGSVNKDHVYAFFNGRNESEIVVDSKWITFPQIEGLTSL